MGLLDFTEYPAGASLDALSGRYHTPEGASVWLADVELEPYQALLVNNSRSEEESGNRQEQKTVCPCRENP